MSLETDVIIIGGGLSGLSAAYQLLFKVPSFRVAILESENVVGGRIKSLPIEVASKQTRTFDLGGQWISSSQNYVMDLIEKFNIQLIPQNFSGNHVAEMNANDIIVYENSLPIFSSLISHVEILQLLAKIDSLCLCPSSYDSKCEETMEFYLNHNLVTKCARNTVSTLIKTFYGVNTSDISIATFIKNCRSSLGMINQYMCVEGGAREFSIKGGAFELCTKLASLISPENIFRNARVLKITRNEDCVFVDTQNYTFSCKHIILAIPPKNVLEIEFEPDLPPFKIGALEKMIGGNIYKFVITYLESFWTKSGYSGHILCYQGPVFVTYDCTVKNYPAIMGYAAFGQFSTEEELKEQILNQLSRYWGDEALEPIQMVLIEWSDNTSCPWYVEAVGAEDARQDIQNPVERLYWAGTETSPLWNGYIEGAIYAGLLAATELIFNERPQALSLLDVVSIMPYFRKNRSIIQRFYPLQEYMSLSTVGLTVSATVLLSSYMVFHYYKKK